MIPAWWRGAGAVLAPLLAALACQTAAAETLFVKALDKTGAPLPDVVIYLEPAGGAPTDLPPPADATVAQQGRQFVPYVTVVRQGAKVYFPNRDNFEHHVKSFSAAKEFELKIYSSGTPPPVTFDNLGVVQLNCLLHDWMRGYIYVVDTPYYSHTEPNGETSITGIPDGKYNAVAWHPDMGSYFPPVSQSVTIGAGVNTLDVALDLKPKKRKEPRPLS